MNPEILLCIFGVLAVFAVVAIVAGLILRHLLKPENMQKALQQQAEQTHQEDVFDTTVVTRQLQATVVDLHCSVELIGTKTPRATKIFTVIFRTEEGKVCSLCVPEEMYEGIEKEQTGLLTLVDGQLYSFEPL